VARGQRRPQTADGRQLGDAVSGRRSIYGKREERSMEKGKLKTKEESLKREVRA